MSEDAPILSNNDIKVVDLERTDLVQNLRQQLTAANARADALALRLEQLQESMHDLVPVVQANKDIERAVADSEQLLRKHITDLTARADAEMASNHRLIARNLELENSITAATARADGLQAQPDKINQNSEKWCMCDGCVSARLDGSFEDKPHD